MIPAPKGTPWVSVEAFGGCRVHLMRISWALDLGICYYLRHSLVGSPGHEISGLLLQEIALKCCKCNRQGVVLLHGSPEELNVQKLFHSDIAAWAGL